MTHPKKEFMLAAIEQAKKTREEGDYAIGAVVVKGSEIIARAGNRIRLDQDPTQHAEIVAIRKASKALNSRHLEECILYTTHEPCPMCSSAAVFAKIKGIVSGTKLEDMSEYAMKNNSAEWSWRTINVPASIVLQKGNPKPFLVEEFMRSDCKELFHH